MNHQISKIILSRPPKPHQKFPPNTYRNSCSDVASGMPWIVTRTPCTLVLRGPVATWAVTADDSLKATLICCSDGQRCWRWRHRSRKYFDRWVGCRSDASGFGRARCPRLRRPPRKRHPRTRPTPRWPPPPNKCSAATRLSPGCCCSGGSRSPRSLGTQKGPDCPWSWSRRWSPAFLPPLASSSWGTRSEGFGGGRRRSWSGVDRPRRLCRRKAGEGDFRLT